jgi:hAT family C-terminal dimerisation region
LKDFIRVKKISEPIKSELDEYLADALDETSLDDDFDILAWWKLKAPKYFILARLTRDILAVPISTVASESIFSIGGRTLNTVRNSLNDESLKLLYVLKIGCVFQLLICVMSILVFCSYCSQCISYYVIWHKMVENLMIHYGPVMRRH